MLGIWYLNLIFKHIISLSILFQTMIKPYLPLLVLLLIMLASGQNSQLESLDQPQQQDQAPQQVQNQDQSSIIIDKVDRFVITPIIYHEQFPPQRLEKLPYQNVSQFIREINFELSYDIFMREGALVGNQIHNIAAYNPDLSFCRLYKTDLKVTNYREVLLQKGNIEYLLVQNRESKNGTIAKILMANEQNRVSIYQIDVTQKFGNIPIEEIQWELTNFQFKSVGSFDPNENENERISFLENQEAIYFLSKSSMSLYIHPERVANGINSFSYGDPKVAPIKGYTQSEEIIEVAMLQKSPQSLRSRFYRLTQKSLQIFEFISDSQVSLITSIQSLKQQNKIQASLYENGFFYITGLNALYVIDISNGISNPTTTKIGLNGTCYRVQKFQSTLHITCNYNKVNYIIELYAVGAHMRLNRYYASQDIKGRALTRRLGFGKLGIMTDNDIRFLSYGVNRNILQELQSAQPQFVFSFKFGVEMFFLKSMSNNAFTSILLFTAEKMTIIQLHQIPPELYCEFPKDRAGAQYQILMKFNVSRCSYIKNEEEQTSGNMENICQISYPLLIRSKTLQLETKHTNFITTVLFVLITGLVLLLIGCIIKYNRSLETKFHNIQKKLQMVKKGYNDKKIII